MFWLECNGSVSSKTIKLIEEYIGANFPKSFVELVRDCDGGYLLKREFKFFDIDYKDITVSVVASFLTLNQFDNRYDSILYKYKYSSTFFPENIIAFADTGCGDLICFDYRLGKDNDNPPIVYWNHEAEEGKDVSFIANNFEEFLGMLYEPEDDEV